MKPVQTIIDALRHPKLFGALPAFRDLSTWGPWLAVLAMIYGLPLDPSQLDLYRKFTGREVYDPPKGGWSEVVLCTGRQAGKSRISGLIGAWEAARTSESKGGSGEYAIILAQDRTAATRALAGYAFEPFTEDSPSLFAQAATGRTQETLSLNTGCTLAVYPCRPASVRGVRARVVLLDEIDHFGSDLGTDVGRAVLTAARPCVATTGGRIVVLSSPGRVGSAFHSLVQRYHGVEGAPVLVIRAAAHELNLSLGADYLARMAEDPIAFESEVNGNWVEGTSQLFDESALAACVVVGLREIVPEACPSRVACFVDPSAGGKRGDRFAAAWGFRQKDRITVAALRAWDPPFSPAAVIAEVGETCKRYGVREVVGDRFAGQIVVEQFRDFAGLTYRHAPVSASDLYLDALSAVQAGTIDLPDPALSDTAAELVQDLRSVIRKSGGAKDRAEAPRGAGRAGHADLGNAVAGLVSILPRAKPKPRCALPVGIGGRNRWNAYSRPHQAFELLDAA